jgi:PAS domain S-box-containing protein
MAVETTRSRRSTKPKPKTANTLVIEAKAGDWKQHQNRLAVADFDVETVTFGVRATKRLEKGGFDLILIDGSAAATKAQNLLAKIRKTNSISDLPVIMVTPKSGSAETVRALESGANDCVAMPLDLPVLAARIHAQRAAKEAMSPRKAGNRTARGSVDWLQLIMDSATTAIFETGADGVISRMNMTASFVTGRDGAELLGKTLGSIFVDDCDRDLSSLLARVAADGYFVSNHPARLRDEFGEERVLSLSLRRIGDDTRGNGVVVTAEDITETWRRRSSTSLPVETHVRDHRPPPPASAAPSQPETIVGRALMKGARSAAEQGRDDHRSDPRHRVFKGAKLSFNNDGSLMDCVVRDISDSGAKLMFENYFDCPRLVRLRISDGRAYDCEVRWFANKIMGVNFQTKVEKSDQAS